jgi:TonB-linked SusC/RagA family outer membrane protein
LESLSPSKADNQNNGESVQLIQGTVTDETNNPLPGVNVLVRGTTLGTTTDLNGIYKIRVSDPSAVLVFSFIGYSIVERPVGIQTSVNISLEPDMRALDEVVVIGYGSVKKSDLTGAVSSISKKEIGDRQVSDLASLIQGRAPGVDVSQGTIRIRGITSFNNTDPLVVIDGFIGGNMSSVNANDIENIEILKDASSTAIYGSRGANGVILVTTKMGKPGPLVVNLRYFEGISQVPKKLDLLNATQYIDYVHDLLNNSGIALTPKLQDEELRIDKTDWQDEVFKTSHNRELNVDLSGGSEQTSYFLSVGYRRTENPTFMGKADDLFYVRSRNNFTVTKWLRGGSNFAISYNSFKGGGEAGNPGNLDHTLNAPTYIPVKDPTGDYSTTDRNEDMVEFVNPIASAVHRHMEGNGINYLASLWAEIEPLKGLTYKLVAGVNGDFWRNQFSNDSYLEGRAGTAVIPARLSKIYADGISPLVEQYITYKNAFRKHDFSAMVGNTWQKGSRTGKIGISGQELDLSVQSVLTAKTSVVTDDAIGKYAYLSYFGRVIYQYADKYLMTLNIRADASPKFAPGNRWGTFPSIAVAWKLHDEPFMKGLNFFDQLKLRGGWGVSGNDAIGDFRYLSQLYTNNVYYPFGGYETPTKGAAVLNLSAPNIKWESTEATSIGLDVAIFENKLNFSADYYLKKTSDILYEVPRAVSLGYGGSFSSGNAIINAASMENKGIEIQAGYQSVIGALKYSVNANYSHNKNEVTSLGGGGSYLDGINRTDIDNPVGYFYGFIADGVFMTQQEIDAANAVARSRNHEAYQLAITGPGDVRFVDVNGDGQVTNDDRTKIGSPHPVHFFGLNLNLDYKGFDFNVFLQGIGGSSIYEGNYDRIRGGNYVLNQSTYVLGRWRNEGDPGNGVVPRVVIGDPAQNNRASTLKVSSGNYLKVRQMSVGYTLGKSLTSRAGIKTVRIYLSAYNFWTFSKYDYGFDPEVGGGNLTRGYELGINFPVPKMLMLGFQLQLQ